MDRYCCFCGQLFVWLAQTPNCFVAMWLKASQPNGLVMFMFCTGGLGDIGSLTVGIAEHKV
eukprot:774372-Amphidinium_carterae.2